MSPRPWTAAELRRAAEMVADGVRAADVAEALDRTPVAVRNALYRAGLSSRPRYYQQARGERWRAYALAIQLRAEGVAWRSVHARCVRQLGYAGSCGALRAGTWAYRRALSRSAPGDV